MELNIESLVIKQVQLEIDKIDLEDMVLSLLLKQIQKIARTDLETQIKQVSKELISSEIGKILDGEVVIDDGFGKRATYQSFADLFKIHLKRAMDEKYEVKRDIDRLVGQRVDSLIKQDYQRVLTKIVDEISKSRIVDPVKA